jgi:hypothetical protein
MRTVLSLGLVLVLAGAVQTKGLRFLVVDAQSGAPIAGATVERWASQWQPRILLPPGKFWFPEGRGMTDRGGFTALEKMAGDDHYYIKAEGYVVGFMTRSWFKYRLSDMEDGAAREVLEQSGALVVPLRRSAPKQRE